MDVDLMKLYAEAFLLIREKEKSDMALKKKLQEIAEAEAQK